MCGIAGFSLSPDRMADSQVLRCMCDAIAHRGPDDDGYLLDGASAMGMRRLSIIDLAGGKQPIANGDETKHIVFNGEIYNYQDVRQDLVNRGHEFKTFSDTEVILHAYEEYGKACVHRLNGMFAFSIWDAKEREFFIARDRMGVKPLYYYWDGRTFLFASEIKALLASGLVQPGIEPQAIWDYLTFRYVPQDESIWKHVAKLPPAHTLRFSERERRLEIERYWDIPYEDRVQEGTPEDQAAQFEELFLDAVRLRLIADVPVGVLLSGGIDSSAVAAAIQKIHNASLNSFTVSFKDSPQTNELSYAREVSRWTGTTHHEIEIGEREFIDFLPAFVYQTDEPLADLASIPLYYVSTLARQHVKVVLSGEGSDEILAGYSFDRTQQMWNAFRRLRGIAPGFWRGALPLLKRMAPAAWHSKLDWLGNRPEDWHRTTPFNMTHFLSPGQQSRLMPDFQPRRASYDILLADARAAKSVSPLHQALYIYCQSWLVEDLLMKADKMTMATSLELRVPFLDYRLVEWAARAPEWVKVGGGPAGEMRSKWVLRKFAEKYLPERIVNRPKQGFPVPVYDWLSTNLKPWAHGLLSTPTAAVYEYLDRGEVAAYLARGTQGSADTKARHALWHILILELWLQAWNRPGVTS